MKLFVTSDEFQQIKDAELDCYVGTDGMTGGGMAK